MDAKIGVVENRIAVDTNLVIRYDLFLFSAEPDPWEESVLVNVSCNLVKNLVGYALCSQFSLFFIFKKRHLVA
jgi:hypothetical protein